jgi:hypothetical protein
VARKDIGAFALFNLSEQFPHRLAQRDALVPVALCAFLPFADNVDEAVLEINMFPFQAKELIYEFLTISAFSVF